MSGDYSTVTETWGLGASPEQLAMQYFRYRMAAEARLLLLRHPEGEVELRAAVVSEFWRVLLVGRRDRAPWRGGDRVGQIGSVSAGPQPADAPLRPRCRVVPAPKGRGWILFGLAFRGLKPTATFRRRVRGYPRLIAGIPPGCVVQRLGYAAQNPGTRTCGKANRPCVRTPAFSDGLLPGRLLPSTLSFPSRASAVL